MPRRMASSTKPSSHASRTGLGSSLSGCGAAPYARRIKVGAAGEHERVETVEHRCHGVGRGGLGRKDDDGRPGRHERLAVAPGEKHRLKIPHAGLCTIQITGDAYNGCAHP